MKKIIGIDLGTTTSCVAVCECGSASVISTHSGSGSSKVMPSIVAYTDHGLKVGEMARRQAVLYPTETIQAIPGSKPTLTFQVADELSRHGYDYDFIDYQSLRNAVISDAKISVAGENYKVLVLADAMAMHESTVKAIEAFKAAGGISSAEDAMVYYAIVSSVLGPEWLNKDLFRLGVSRLGNALMSEIEGTKVNFF